MSCVQGPNDNPLQRGEISIRMDICTECGKKLPFGKFPRIVGVPAWSPELGDFIRPGVLCPEHESIGVPWEVS